MWGSALDNVAMSWLPVPAARSMPGFTVVRAVPPFLNVPPAETPSVTDHRKRMPVRGPWMLAAVWLACASGLHAGQPITSKALLGQFALPSSFRAQSVAYAKGARFP